MKTYQVVDLRGDSYLNPSWGGHTRALSQATHIAVHHDASVRPHSYDSIARYRSEASEHYKRLGPGLQYHFKIDNVGTIYQIRDLSMWLYAVGSPANVNTVNICLDGYFHPPYNQQPTREQYEALSQLLVKLCENTPSIPATYPQVWAHRSFSSTACCGDKLVPYVFQISNKATAENIPNVPYDWPDLQPSTPAPTPQPTPEPTPPADNRPEYEKNFKTIDKIMWSEGSATVIDIADGKKVLSTLADNTQIEIGGETNVGSAEYYISKYWAGKNVHSKVIPKAQLKDTADAIPVHEPPIALPPEKQTDDWGQQNNTLLKQILAIVELILSKITNIFK